MRFLYPLGLIGLIGVPIIIIIYILKNKFNEQTVPSTYLWILSERFFKRRNPLSGLTGIISLILQLLTVVAISLAIARPIITVPDSAGEYCFVLDGSSSMLYKEDGESRFDRAKYEIGDAIEDAKLGSTYTLIFASDSTSVVYERISDKEVALDMLNELECGEGSGELSTALGAAQKYFDENPSFSVMLYTDKTVEEHKNVDIINVSAKNPKNYCIFDVDSTFLGGKLTVSATVVSYGADESVRVALYLDGGETPAAKTTVNARDGEDTAVELVCDAESYRYFRVEILDGDGYMLDNSFTSYNLENEADYNVLIVSKTPFFLQAAMDVLTDAEIDVISPEKYTGEGNYGLYVFHSFTPETLPDAAVWLINSSENVGDSGFGARGVVTLDSPSEIEMTNSTSTTAKRLLGGVYGKDIYISEYVKYGGMYSRFTTLFSYDSNPLIFAGVNAMGNREVVIGFDLHKADFSLSTDFVVLLGNLLEYSCPDVITHSDYVCGDDLEINLTANMKNVKLLSPSGEEIYVDISATPATVKLDRAGSYTVKLMAAGVEKSYKVYSGADRDESDPVATESAFSLEGERQFERSDGEFDPLVILLISLALLFCADWMVYCYEKYQLR